jgi:hypothetical protein
MRIDDLPAMSAVQITMGTIGHRSRRSVGGPPLLMLAHFSVGSLDLPMSFPDRSSGSRETAFPVF